MFSNLKGFYLKNEYEFFSAFICENLYIGTQAKCTENFLVYEYNTTQSLKKSNLD